MEGRAREGVGTATHEGKCKGSELGRPRAGIQLISETRQEGEKALLSDEACVRAGGGSNISMHHCHSFAGCPHILSSTSDMRGIRCRHVDIAYTEGSQGP